MRARTEAAKHKRRQAVLDAALDEFFENGFSGARMDDIAARAGLSKGALYLYFDSKEALFMGLVDAVAIPRIEEIEAAADAAPSASAALHAIFAIAPVLIRQSPLPRMMKVLIGDGVRFPEVAATYRRTVLNRVLGVMSSILKRGHDEGEFELESPELTSRLVIAPVVLSAVWHILFESDPEAQVDLEALFALHERLLLNALKPARREA